MPSQSIPWWYDTGWDPTRATKQADPGGRGPWDILVVNDKSAPGLCKISGRLGEDIDRQKAPGKEGARIKSKGRKGGDIRFQIRVDDRQDFAALVQLHRNVIQPAAGKHKYPVRVSHPALVWFEIPQIYVEYVELPDLDETGVLLYQFTAVQFAASLGDLKNAKDIQVVTVPGALPTAFDRADSDNPVLRPAPHDNPKAKKLKK